MFFRRSIRNWLVRREVGRFFDVCAIGLLCLGGFLVLPDASYAADWYNVGWLDRRAITINHLLVSSTTGETYQNFPVVVNMSSDAHIAAHAASDGSDILFTEGDGMTKLSHEIESYVSSTGQLVAWVKIPSLPTSTDTVLYLYYGNPNAPNQQRATSTWNADYGGVWHLGNGSFLNANDSTVNANHGTVSSSLPVAGKIGGGASFSSSTLSRIIINSSTAANPGHAGTLSVWYQKSAAAYGVPVSNTSLSVTKGFEVLNYPTNARFEWGNGSTYSSAKFTNNTIATGTWVYMAATWDGSVTRTYYNGVFATSTAQLVDLIPKYALQFGGSGDLNAGYFFNGIIDEVEISGVARSADWITTQYNNQLQSASGTFMSVAGEEVISAPTSSPVISSFAAVPDTITAGQSSTLSWRITGAETVAIDQGIGSVTSVSSGSLAVYPATTMMYLITATNVVGVSTSSVVVSISSDAVPPSVPTGLHGTSTTPTSITLAWSASTDDVGVAGYRIYRNGILAATSTAISLTDTGLTASTTYEYAVAAYDAVGNTSATSTGVVVATIPMPPPPVIASFMASPSSIVAGQTSTLAWSVTGASSLSIDMGLGDMASTTSGSIITRPYAVFPAATTTYTLSATNFGGTTTSTVVIALTPPSVTSTVLAYVADGHALCAPPGTTGQGSAGSPCEALYPLWNMIRGWNPDWIVTGGDNTNEGTRSEVYRGVYVRLASSSAVTSTGTQQVFIDPSWGNGDMYIFGSENVAGGPYLLPAGYRLAIDEGDPDKFEAIYVTSVNATNFTATFTKPHAAGALIRGSESTLWQDYVASGRYLPTLGNHDSVWGNDDWCGINPCNGTPAYNAYAEFYPELYGSHPYWVKQLNSLVTVIDVNLWAFSNTIEAAYGSAQEQFSRSVRANCPTRWCIGVTHGPPLGYVSQRWIAGDGVDLVLSGHEHWYVDDLYQNYSGSKTIHWIDSLTSGGGINYTAPTSTCDGCVRVASADHMWGAIKLAATNDRLDFEFRNASGTLLDSFSIDKTDVTSPSVALTAPTPGATVSSTIALMASSTDDVAVRGVQFRIDGADVGAFVTATTSPFVYQYSWNTAAVSNATHTVSAVAYDTSNNSSTASLVVTVANPATTSTPPQNFSAASGLGSVALSWSAPSSTGGSSLTQYIVDYKLTASSTYQIFATSSPSVTTTTVTGLTNGASYDFRVFAQNGVGTSTPAVVSSTPGDMIPPSVPANVTATSTASSTINLAWNASTDNVGVAGYQVFRGGAQIATTSNVSYLDGGLSASTTYVYVVKAFDAAGNISTASTSTTATTQGDTAGGASPQCSDGIDNDFDGSADYPADLGCANASDADEFSISAPATTTPVAGGLLWYPAEMAAVSNMLTNPGFETVSGTRPVGWDGATWSTPGFSLDAAVSHSGGNSLRIDNANLTAYSETMTQSLAVKNGDVYQLHGWIKTQNLGLPTSTGSGARICFSSPYGTNLGGRCTSVFSETNDWQYVSISDIVFSGDTTGTFSVGPYAEPSGTAWFDDVSLEKVPLQPIRVFMKYPNYRGYLFDDQSQTVLFSVSSTAPSGTALSDYIIRTMLVDDAASSTVLSSSSVSATSSYDVSFDMSSRPISHTYIARFQLVRASDGAVMYEYPGYRISKVSSSTRSNMVISFDEDNRILFRGTPKFLLGVYDSGMGYTTASSSWVNDILTPQRRLFELPINFYDNYWYGGAPSSSMEGLSQAFQPYGIDFIHTVNCSGEVYTMHTTSPLYASSSVAQAFSTISRMGGFYVMDECVPELAGNVFADVQYLNSYKPDGITFAAANQPASLWFWRDTADLISMDPYPMYGAEPSGGYPFNMVADWTRFTRDAVQDARPIATVIQYFKFTSNSRWPTQDELRNMSYMAIANGSNGLVYWSIGVNALAYICDGSDAYHSPSGSTSWCQARVDKFNELKAVVTEIDSLQNALSGIDYPARLSTNSSALIRTRVKSADGFDYLVASNYASTTVSATFTWAAAIDQVAAYNENRSLAIVSSSTFTDTFAPFAAHIYQIAASTSTDITPPSAPQHFAGTASSTSAVDLSWTASTDNAAVAGYQVFRGDIQIATTTQISYEDTGLAAGTAYAYTVAAFDAAGNISSRSLQITVTTLSGGTSGGTTATSGGGGGGGGGGGFYTPITSPAAGGASSRDPAATIQSLLGQLQGLILRFNALLVPQLTRTLTVGSVGPDVAILQSFLNVNGHTVASSGPGSFGNESQYFGARTAAALARFQAANGLPAVGALGPMTLSFIQSATSIVSSSVAAQASSQAAPSASIPPIFAKMIPLSVGDEGSAVAAFQDVLVRDGYLVSGVFSRAVFDPVTLRAVQSFQCIHGIACSVADPGYGTVGPKTRAALGL